MRGYDWCDEHDQRDYPERIEGRQLRLQVSASSIANALSGPAPRSYPRRRRTDGGHPNVELTREIVQQIMARFSFVANAQVQHTDARMTAELLDVIV